MIRVNVSHEEALALFPCKEIERSKDDAAGARIKIERVESR